MSNKAKKKGIANHMPYFIKWQSQGLIIDIGIKILERATGVIYSEIGDDIDEIMDQVEADELMKQGKLKCA
jgi:hypothetical protein